MATAGRHRRRRPARGGGRCWCQPNRKEMTIKEDEHAKQIGHSPANSCTDEPSHGMGKGPHFAEANDDEVSMVRTEHM